MRINVRQRATEWRFRPPQKWARESEVLPARVFDLATGKQIKFCFFADDQTGEYAYLDYDKNDKILFDKKGVREVWGWGRIRIETRVDVEPALIAGR